MKLSKELLALVEAKNHLGETVYSTFAGWKAACKKQDPTVWFDGDADICNAFVGAKPYKRGETRAIGEWDGAEGSLFVSESVTESMVPLSKIKPGQTLRWVEDGEEKVGKVVADPKYNGGMRIGGRSVKNIFDQGSTTEMEILKEGAVKDFIFGRGIAMYSKPGYYMFNVNMQPKAGPFTKEEASTYKMKNPSTDMFFIDSESQFKLRMSSGIKESVSLEIGPNSTVHVTSGEFMDHVGEVLRLSGDKKFAVVKLFSGKGEHTFHIDDLTLEVEGNDVDDEDGEESDGNTFYVAIYDEDEHTHWIGEISKSNGTKWHETTYSGKADYRWGQSYMSYLTPRDVMSWINKDYGRSYDIGGPFDTAEEAEEYVEQNFGGQVNEATSYTDFDDWKKAVLHSYPAQAKKIQFKGRFEGGKHTISAEIPNEDRSYGVWDGDADKGVVLSEGATKSVKALASKIGKWLVSPVLTKEHMQSIKDLVDAEMKLGKSREDVVWSSIMKEMSAEQLTAISKNREIKAVARAAALKEIRVKRNAVTEGKWSHNAITGAKLDARTGKAIPPTITLNKPTVKTPDLDAVWRKVEDVIGQIFPDGDPIDWMAPWLRKQGVPSTEIGDLLKNAAKKNGYKDMYAYWDKLKAQMNEGVDGETPTSFNDDDWYEYDPKTLVIKKRSGPTYYRAEQKLGNGNMVVRGMKAKRLGLKKE